MKAFRAIKLPVTLAVCLGMALPAPMAQGADTDKPSRQPSLEVTDVSLDAQGTLQGVVVDIHGAPQPAAKVVLVQQKREVGRVQTDQLGRFRVTGLRSGVYMLQSGGQGRFVRAWSDKKAPPNAKPVALMITGDGVVRGQMPLEDFFASDAVIIAGLVAALITIPIVASSHGDSSAASP